MAYDLEITIAGMCLLVRDTDATPRMLHVLMPGTGADVHSPKLLYRKAHETPRAQGMEKIDLQGKQLDLTHLSASNGFNLRLPLDVFDFGTAPFGRSEVARTCIDGAALPSEIRSRVKISAGGYADHRPGAKWFIQDQNGSEVSVRMATAIVWKLENVPDDTLVLDFGGSEQHTLFPLPGTAGESLIRLLLVHVMPAELDRITDNLSLPVEWPNDRHRAHHFTHYLPLVKPTPTAGPPEYDAAGTETFGVTALHPPRAKALHAGSELTCMVATAPATP